MRHYVVPGLKVIAKAQREQEKREEVLKNRYNLDPPNMFQYRDRRPPVSIEDLPQSPVNMRPARGLPNKELGMLLAAIKCFNVSISTETLGHVYTGNPPVPKRDYTFKNREITVQDQIHTMIKRSSRTLKRILKKDPRRKLILPGRDVWLWSVYCHKKGIPHIFDPRISRNVSRNTMVLRQIADAWKIDEHTIIFDTGFAGSIFDAITRATNIRGINLMLSTSRRRRGTGEAEQLYPNHTAARAKALTIEYLPKYQKTGTTIQAHIKTTGCCQHKTLISILY